MQNIQNFEQMRAALEKMKNQNWEFGCKIVDYILFNDIFVNPELFCMGVFNKLVWTRSSWTFSIIQISDANYFQDLADSYNKYKTITACEVTPIAGKKKEFTDATDQALYVIQEVFSESFLREHNFNRESLTDLLSQMKSQYENASGTGDLLPVCRIEEIRNDFRIILMISALDGDLKLSFAHLADEGIFNPLTGYFESRFNYEPKKFNRFCARNEVVFTEEQGYPKYPLFKNNHQTFKIVFSLIGEGEPMAIMKRSNTALKKQLSEILGLMDILIGPDLRGRTVLDKKFDYLDSIPGSSVPENQKLFLSLLRGERNFAHPEYDIRIQFGPKPATDDDGHEFFVSELLMDVRPWDNTVHPKRGTFLHPIIYDLEK